MNMWNYSSEVCRSGLCCLLKSKWRSGSAWQSVPSLIEEVCTEIPPEMTAEGSKALLLLCLCFFLSTLCAWSRTETQSSMFQCRVVYSMLDIIYIKSVLLLTGHLKVQFQVNPMEILSCDPFFRETRKNMLFFFKQVTSLPVAVHSASNLFSLSDFPYMAVF